MHTPWGPADDVQDISGDGTIIYVSTAGHGGIGVATSRKMPPAYASIPIVQGDWRWFEHDCAMCAPVLAFPHLFKPDGVQQAKDTLRNWYPMVFAMVYGHTPTAEESTEMARLEFEVRTKDKFVPRVAWGDWAWNVPEGQTLVRGVRKSDGAEAEFLVPNDDYKTSRMVLDSYPRWSPDRTLPYTKPKADATLVPA